MQNSYDDVGAGKSDEGERQAKGCNTKVISRMSLSTTGKTRTNLSLKGAYSKDKELINSGLQKFVTNFSHANKLKPNVSRVTASALPRKVESKARLLEGSNELSVQKGQESHIVLSKQISVDKYTMTDFAAEREEKLEQATSILNEDADSYDPCYKWSGKDLQWTDPRLLKKYSLVNRPYKKSFSIPLASKSERHALATPEVSDEDDATELYTKKQNYLLRGLHYFCTASVSFIGSLCGITLITVILWKILDENIFNLQLFQSEQHEFFLKRLILTVFRGIVYMASEITGKVTRLLTIQTREVFGKENETPWYSRW